MGAITYRQLLDMIAGFPEEVLDQAIYLYDMTDEYTHYVSGVSRFDEARPPSEDNELYLDFHSEIAWN